MHPKFKIGTIIAPLPSAARVYPSATSQMLRGKVVQVFDNGNIAVNVLTHMDDKERGCFVVDPKHFGKYVHTSCHPDLMPFDRQEAVMCFNREGTWNLKWYDLRFADLSKLNLAGACLSGMNLTGADFTGSTLDRADLSDCDLNDAIFDGCRMLKTCLKQSRLKRASFVNVEAPQIQLYESDCLDTTFDGVNFKDSDCWLCDFTGSTFCNMSVEGSRFHFASFKNAEFKDNSLREAKADFEGARF